MSRTLRSLTVFCGSSPGTDPSFVRAAETFGQRLAARDIALVYGGGGNGMMGAVARATLEAGGRAIGVIPTFLTEKEEPLPGLSELHHTTSMHERKTKMAELGDAFVALPGGIGTFEELFEILTWSQLGIHSKPVGILHVGAFFDPLIALVDGAVTAGFLRAVDRTRLVDALEPDELLDRLAVARIPPSVLSDDRLDLSPRTDLT
ncbi:MAG: TIGR00730 family Rossman fold protein [Planctomycetes bacterium]|nr:TIGR00730 family Rossman fold protein [Planctomycetota bacterium]